ncbi:hypothetical protein OKA06_02435 [Novosphingobium sp. MW5]|nr:hypothetical protein [Novosphingobium sp. MW5]
MKSSSIASARRRPGRALAASSSDLARRIEAREVIVIVIGRSDRSGRCGPRLHAGEADAVALRLGRTTDAAGKEKPSQAAHDEERKCEQDTEGEAQRRGRSGHDKVQPQRQDSRFEERRANRQAAESEQGGEPQGDHRRKQRMAANRQFAFGFLWLRNQDRIP